MNCYAFLDLKIFDFYEEVDIYRKLGAYYSKNICEKTGHDNSILDDQGWIGANNHLWLT